MWEATRSMLTPIAWPVALLAAWLLGEIGERRLSLPRVSVYGLVGFVLGAGVLGWLPKAQESGVATLANLAFGLVLFELGYRIHLRWMRHNPWLLINALAEAAVTFAVVLAVARSMGVESYPALLLATLSMAASPAAVLRVINDSRSAGQVTERVLHLTAISSLVSVLVFKGMLTYGLLTQGGQLFAAFWHGFVTFLVSAALGVVFGVGIPRLLRIVGASPERATLFFALAVLLLTLLVETLKFSPLLATLVFGLTVRHRRTFLTPVARNFGLLGDVLTILLFVFVGASIEWRENADTLALAAAIVALRLVSKTLLCTLFAHPSGTTWRKGALTGLALAPMSVFALLLIEQSRHVSGPLVTDVGGIMAIVLCMEVVGPWLTRSALALAGETQEKTDAS